MMNITISLDNKGDHPLFNFQLLAKDGKYRIEQGLRFAACRDFHVKLLAPCEVKLQSPFPETKKRSSLGIKLSQALLIERTTALNEYMSEVLDRFVEFPLPIQKAFITLLSADSVPLAYFTDEVDTSIPELRDSSSQHTIDTTSIAKIAPQRTGSGQNVIVSHTANDLEAIRISQLHTQMEIEITLLNKGDHPLYKMQLYSKDHVFKVEQTMRFGPYRDFYQRIMENCSLKMKTEFPDTKKRSSLGLKLTEEELEARASMLKRYFNEMITRFVDLPADTKIAFIAFLKADYIPVLYFNTPDVIESKDKQDHNVKPKASQSLSKKLLHQMSHLSGRNSCVEDALEGEKIMLPPLMLQVSRILFEGRVLFDVIMRVTADDKPITVCSRPFKEFRQLRSDIIGNLQDVEAEFITTFPDFPVTFSKSSFGISLNELEIVERVRGLDDWTRAIAKYYPSLSNRSQLFINHFFNLDCLVNNEKFEKPIRDQLVAGNVFRDDDNLVTSNSFICEEPGDMRATEVFTEIDGQGKYGVLRSTTPCLDTNGFAEDKEPGWTVIGQKKGDENAPPKGCCVVS